MEKLKSGKIKIISNQGRSAIPGKIASKRFSFFGFSSSSPVSVAPGISKSSFDGPLFKGAHLSRTSGRMAAIEKWVALEEKIVHDYKIRKAPVAKTTPPLSVSTSVSYAKAVPVLKKPAAVRNPSPKGSQVLWVSGLVLAGLCVFFYGWELPQKQAVSSRIAGILSEKNRAEQSYAEIRTVSGEQRGKIQQLNGRIQRMNAELQTLRKKVAGAEKQEQAYRQELMRITANYEMQLDSLRASLRTRDAIIAALRVQTKAMEKVIDQGSLSAVSGVASLVAQPASSGGNDSLRGKVTQLNIRQAFFVVNIGYETGARSKGAVRVYREGLLIGKGVVDRVYPTMSTVTMLGRGALYAVREGDLVLF